MNVLPFAGILVVAAVGAAFILFRQWSRKRPAAEAGLAGRGALEAAGNDRGDFTAERGRQQEDAPIPQKALTGSRDQMPTARGAEVEPDPAPPQPPQAEIPSAASPPVPEEEQGPSSAEPAPDRRESHEVPCDFPGAMPSAEVAGDEDLRQSVEYPTPTEKDRLLPPDESLGETLPSENTPNCRDASAREDSEDPAKEPVQTPSGTPSGEPETEAAGKASAEFEAPAPLPEIGNGNTEPSDPSGTGEVRPPEADNGQGSSERIPQYRAPKPRQKVHRPADRPNRPEKEPAGGTLAATLEVRIRARIERSGRYEFSMLFARPSGGPDFFEIGIEDRSARLEPCDLAWYEGPPLPAATAVLSRGLSVPIPNAAGAWVLSGGRPFYIFGHELGLGWVNRTRLALGERQFVLVSDAWAQRASSILAGAAPVERQPLENASGIDGWTAFGPFVAERAIAPVEGEDLENLLRPPFGIEISLDGGLWLRGSEWLAGFPPSIHVAGELPPGEAIWIDETAAIPQVDGSFTVNGYDAVGSHLVRCAGKSISYAVSEAPENWSRAEAHRQTRAGIVGVLAVAEMRNGERLTSTPMTNRLLLGSRPGQFFECPQRFGPVWSGLVPFEPTWAIPVDPVHSDRTTMRVIRCAPGVPVVRVERIQWEDRQKHSRLRRWYSAVLDCSRRRLNLQDQQNAELWSGYLNEARRVRKLLR